MSDIYSRDRIALQDVLLNYAAAMDERDFERYRTCFAQDVEVLGFGKHIHQGRDAWVNFTISALEKYSSTQHLLGPQLATINGDEAHTRNDVQSVNFSRDGSARFTLWATYKTTLRRIENRWQITRHELVVRGGSTD